LKNPQNSCCSINEGEAEKRGKEMKGIIAEKY